MLGACDICNAQNTEVSRTWVTGIETFVCQGCNETADYILNLETALERIARYGEEHGGCVNPIIDGKPLSVFARDSLKE